MKREYSRPEILFDSFQLCTTIAGSCEFDTETKSQGDCYVDFGEYKVFTSQVAGCRRYGMIVDSGIFNGYCYHVPVNGQNVFNS